MFKLTPEEEKKQALDQERALALHQALKAVDLAKVPVKSTERHIARKEQARLTRELFKELGLKGISVTAPNYSMARAVDVRLPRRSDFSELVDVRRQRISCMAREANHRAAEAVHQILAVAFPNHDDRSDTQSDHFDFCWSVN